MSHLLVDQFELQRPGDPADPSYVPKTVAGILVAARVARATDIHLTPESDGLRMQWRIDGVLHAVTRFTAQDAPRIVARLKVLAGLLTYRSDIPQEGRIAGEDETRVSTYPTLFGERAVVRLFAEGGRYQWLNQLGLPVGVEETLRGLLGETGGVVLFTGPAGSGKTTTLYSCMREIAAASEGRRSLVTIEDPVEVVLPGVAQSQVNPAADLDLSAGLRALMRQDPEVIMVGEIRDASTAAAVFQAALTGHLVLTSFHAGSAAGAISRLLDMGLEPYLLRSVVRAVVAQRLLRALCECAASGDSGGPESPVEARGCERCGETGYCGRFPIAEVICPADAAAGRAILDREDTAKIESAAIAGGMVSLRTRAMDSVRAGLTSIHELHRVLGACLSDGDD